MDRLKGKTALVVGGNTGIGREVCRLFATESADVAVGDFGREEAGQSLLAELRAMGREAFPLAVMCARKSRSRRQLTRPSLISAILDISVNAGISGHQGPLQDEISTSGTR